MKQKIISFGLLAGLVVLLALFLGQGNVGQAVENTDIKPNQTTFIRIKNKTYRVELAITTEEQARGLSYRKTLAPNHGMLFVFSSVSKPTFWMKDMEFPLDIIWIYQDRIVDISRNVPAPAPGTPTDELPLVQPIAGADQVLELNAGEADSFTIGDRVEIIESQTA